MHVRNLNQGNFSFKRTLNGCLWLSRIDYFVLSMHILGGLQIMEHENLIGSCQNGKLLLNLLWTYSNTIQTCFDGGKRGGGGGAPPPPRTPSLRVWG